MKTLGIRPSFLETQGRDGIINYSEWSVPLGRRFRALKLWFVIRSYGVERMHQMVRNHVRWAGEIAGKIANEPDFEIVTQPMLSLFSFRYCPAGVDDVDGLNARLLDAINDDGRICVTQTQAEGHYVIRFQVGQTHTTREDVALAFDVITELARGL